MASRQVAGSLRRARTLGRKLTTISGKDPRHLRQQILAALMELVGADVATHYNLGVKNGLRFLKSCESNGSDLQAIMANLATPETTDAINDNRVRDFSRPSLLERSSFVEDTALWEPEVFLESLPYQTMMAPIGMRYQQRILAYHGRRFLGWLGLARSHGTGPFTPAHRRLLQPLVKPAITALLTAERLERASQPEEAGDIVMCPAGRVLHTSQHGRAWLELPGFAPALTTAVVHLDRHGTQHSLAAGGVTAHVLLVRLDGMGEVRYLAHVSPLESLVMHPDAPLTPKQRQVAYYLAAGATIRETADALNISTETVRTHLRAVYRRLMVANRVELAQALFPQRQP